MTAPGRLARMVAALGGRRRAAETLTEDPSIAKIHALERELDDVRARSLLYAAQLGSARGQLAALERDLAEANARADAAERQSTPEARRLQAEVDQLKRNAVERENRLAVAESRPIPVRDNGSEW